MKKELLQHKFAYLILVIGLAAFVAVFLGMWPDRIIQRFSIVSLFAFYIVWGIVTHVKAQRISRKVIYEYIGVSLLASMLLLLITL